VLAALAAVSLGLYFSLSPILAQHILHMTLNEAVPAHIGADQRGIDVHHFGRGNLRLQAGLNRSFEDFVEAMFAPPLANACQAGMIRQLLMKRISSKPANGDVDLGVAHQLTVVTMPVSRPASISRTATSGSIPGRPSSRQ
jgi:hypothetical protein